MNEFDPHPKRRIVEVNTSVIDGHYLEDVEEIAPGFKPGVALVAREWQPEIYLMRKHDLWGEEDYFQYAQKRIQELHIQEKRKDLVD